MKLIKYLNPLNVLEEKTKFLADPSYNPQFIYEKNIPQEQLEKYNHDNDELLIVAQEILDRAFKHRNAEDLKMLLGPSLPQSEVTEKIHQFLALHGLEHEYELIWSTSFIARTTIGPNYIKLNSAAAFRKDEINSLLYHEIGTHALRTKNYEQQPWYKHKQKKGFHEYLPTEEGLAILHGLIPLKFQLAFKSALTYIAADWAQRSSFSEIYEKLEKYIPGSEARWKKTLRLKRGLTDTSQPGGFSKDSVYFQGMIQVWHWLHKHDFNPTLLYFGKVSYQDVERAFSLNPTFRPLLPSFYRVDHAKYAETLLQIGKENRIDQLKITL